MNKFLMSAVATTALLGFNPAAADEEDGMKLLQGAKEAMERCEMVAPECGADMDEAAGVLVFPEVLHAHLLVGGAGGNGVLMVDGTPAGYYDIGKASAGLQVGVDENAIVYVFRDDESLAQLTDGDEWEYGASAGATVGQSNADAKAVSDDPVVYAFDADGLNGEVNISLLRIWEDAENADGSSDDDEMDDYGDRGMNDTQ